MTGFRVAKRAFTVLIVVLLTVVLAGTAGGQVSVTRGSDVFDDVPSGHWADEAIGWAVANGITVGVGGGRFDLDGIVTRAQIMTFLYRTVSSLEHDSVSGTPAKGSGIFGDIPSGHWADNAVGWAVSNGIVAGVSEDTFDLNGTVPRAEIVSFLHRTVDLIEDTPRDASPPDGSITFASSRDGDFEIFVMDADGANQQQLTNNFFPDKFPSWSPDGTQIIFNSDRGGGDEIFVMDADGANQRQLTNNSFPDFAPSWSLDGAQIAFNRDVDGKWGVFVMDADGANQRQLTDNTSDNWDPSWSPDGTQIAFTSIRAAQWQIFVVNTDGTNLRQLTNNPYNSAQPAWSPDGTQITFVSDRDGDFEIYVINADGTNQRQITDNVHGDDYPSWSPDGTQITFVSDRDGDTEVFVMDADGANQRQLTSNFDSDFVSLQAWSSRISGAGSNFFDDVAVGHEADLSIGWALANGITAGVGNRLFDPDGTVTRAQIVTFLYRTVNLISTVRFGLYPCCPDFAFWQIPIEKGWFEELGITIAPEGGHLFSTSAEIVPALQRGEVDVATAWVPGVFGLLERDGQNYPPILFQDIYIGYLILVAPDSDAKTALEFMSEGMSFPEAAQAAVRQLVGKTIHMPPHSTFLAQYADAFFAYLPEWWQNEQTGIPALDADGNNPVLMNRDGSPLLDADGNPQPITITSRDWRYYAKPRYVDDPTIVEYSTVPGKVEFAMPLGSPTLTRLIRHGWDPLISFEMLFEHDSASRPTAIASTTTGGTGLLANREWVEKNRDTVFRLLSVGYRTMAYLEDPQTRADGWQITANIINQNRSLELEAEDIGTMLQHIDPLFTWEDQEALWDRDLPSYHPETAFATHIEKLKENQILSAGFDTETELEQFLLAQDLYYEMQTMQADSDKLFAQLDAMELTDEQTALVQQAQTFYQRYNFLDSLRHLQKALGE